MATFDILRANLLSPIVLAFALGVFAKAIRSELTLPKDLYSSLSIYLLLALGLKGGVELSESSIHVIAWPAAATILLGCLTPVSAYFLLRRLGRFSSVDAAGMAAHYGSVSAVTFIAAQQFTTNMGSSAEGFMPTLLTLLESPGIHIALAIGALKRAKHQTSATGHPAKSKSVILHEILTARSMILLVGGLLIGLLMGLKGYEPIKPFFETGFKGALVLFLLEMGIIAGARLKDLKTVGPRIVAFGILLPILHGSIGVMLGHFSGLSVGGASVLGAMAASASYIAAPPAVRMTLPEANPAYYLTASLAVTFPFNLIVGIPLYYKIAIWLNS
ncbi:MAG: sodium-dependent bicarbonate transport family permease [Methylotenera sp.]|nr:sodium-dependent bicarbonate transport family permease [Oligoflexia bacterium]